MRTRTRGVSGVLLGGGLLIISLLATGTPAGANEPTITRYWVPGQGGEASYPQDVTEGPDGRIWFTANTAPEPNEDQEAGDGRAGALAPNGTLAPSPLMDSFSAVRIVSAHGHLWYTDKFYGAVVRMTTTGGGSRTIFNAPSAPGLSRPDGITVDADGGIWVASDTGVLSRLEPATSTPQAPDWLHVDTRNTPYFCEAARGLTSGPDGGIWATCELGNAILRVDPDGDEHERFALPDGVTTPRRIATGHDERLWFTTNNNRIGAFDPITEQFESWVVPGGHHTLSEIVKGPGGDMWFTSTSTNEVGRITDQGVITLYSVPSGSTTNSRPAGLTAVDDELWIAASVSRHLVRFVPGSRFTDVGFEHPFHDDVEWMAQEAITTGYAPALYRPSAAVSRAAMSAFLYRLAAEPAFTPGSPSFSDVATNHPFFHEIEWMAGTDITTGYLDGTFRPQRSVNRQQMAAFMYRFSGDEVGAPSEPSFSDVPIEHPFFHEIEWMVGADVTTGYPGGTFRPDNAVTRQAMAAFMARLADLLDA